MSAAEVVRERLAQAHIRPKELADRIGVSRQMAGMILAGKRNLSVWHLDAVADLLGVTVPELFVPISDLSRHNFQIQPTAGRPTDAATLATLQAEYDTLWNDMQGLANALVEQLADRPRPAAGVPATFRKTG